MKFQKIFILMLLPVLFLAACQSTPQGPAQPESPAGQGAGYPAPQAPMAGYPAPQVAGQVLNPAITYPGLEDGTMAIWPQVEVMAKNKEIAKIVKVDALNVTITLKDGRTFKSTLPQEGMVEALIQICGEACSDIEVLEE